MSKPYILALDPGGMSGLALVKRDGPEVVRTGEEDYVGTIRFIQQVLIEYGPDQVDLVCEEFLITVETAKKTQQTDALELKGAMKTLALLYGGGPVVMQRPGDSMKTFNNKQLRAVNLWHVGGAGHAKEALRHVLLYLVRTGFKDRRLLLDA